MHAVSYTHLSYRRWQASKNLASPAIRSNDTKVRKKDVRYISAHPDDSWYIEQIHAGYSVCPGSVKYISMDNETPAGGYFVSYMLYKSENRYFSRDRYARLRQLSLIHISGNFCVEFSLLCCKEIKKNSPIVGSLSPTTKQAPILPAEASPMLAVNQVILTHRGLSSP